MKKLGAILLTVALVVGLSIPMAIPVSANSDPGLVGLWHFDGNADDSSGNGNDGALEGDAGFDTGYFDEALSLDGDGDYVEVADDATLDGMSALTVEAWVYINSADTGYKGIVDKTAGSGNRSYNIGLRNGKLEWGVANASNTKVTITAPDAAPLDTWIHVAGIYDGDDMYLYIDGSPVSGTQTGDVQDSTTYLAFGRWPGASGYFFDGLIDEVRIWDEALSAQDLGLDLFDVTVAAEGSDLAVDIDYALGSPYVGVSGTDTSEFTLESIIEGTELTLTAPATHTEDYTFYVFDYWSVNEDDTGEAEVTFEVTDDLTATAHYTMVMSADKTLEECYLGTLIDTVTVDANDEDGVSSTATLESGKTYWFKASGTAGAGDTIDFDAKYSITNRISGDTWTDSVSGYESYGPTLLDLQIDSVSPDWGAFNPDHVYWTSKVGTGEPVSFTFVIYDIYYPNNTGSLTVKIYEDGTGEACDPDEVPLSQVVSFGMNITVHAHEDVTSVNVEDGIGADLAVTAVNDSPVTYPMVAKTEQSVDDVTLAKRGGKMGATKVFWAIGDITGGNVCTDYTLDIDVVTWVNPKDKQEYTSIGEHELNSGPEVYFTYDGTTYMLQGPSVMVTVVDED